MKLQQGKNQFWITVPKAIVIENGWRKGDDLHFIRNKKGELTLVSVISD